MTSKQTIQIRLPRQEHLSVAALMLKAACRERQGWLDTESIGKFPGEDAWLDYSNFTFNTYAPSGHLPAKFVRFVVGWGWWFGPFFVVRIAECNL